MKVLLVITGLGVGGAERLVTSLSDEYVANGHEVMLVWLQGEARLTPADPRVKLESLRMRRSPSSVVAGLWRLRRTVLAFRPDVVNSHLVHANILTRLLRLFTSIPCLISSAHNTNEGGWIRMMSYRMTDRLADISTNVSQEAVESFEAKGAVKPGRMLKIHNGINPVKFDFDRDKRTRVREELGLADSEVLLLAVGRLEKQKDYPNLLKAFARLKRHPTEPRLAIAGEGPLRADLETLADSLGVTDRVRFLGVRHDVPGLMCACDVFVLSSAFEGFGLVVAEAMACRRPVVATNCGGVREVLGHAGFLVPPKNWAVLSDALKRALDLSCKQRHELGVAARGRVLDKYSLQVTAERYLAVYRAEHLFGITS